MSSTEMWYYIAGFYDGEGSCYCTKVNKNGRPNSKTWYALRASIDQKDKRILRKIQKFIGYGRLDVEKRPFGTYHALKFACAQARKFLNKLQNYSQCPVKKKRIKDVLQIDKKYVRAR